MSNHYDPELVKKCKDFIESINLEAKKEDYEGLPVNFDFDRMVFNEYWSTAAYFYDVEDCSTPYCLSIQEYGSLNFCDNQSCDIRMDRDGLIKLREQIDHILKEGSSGQPKEPIWE